MMNQRELREEPEGERVKTPGCREKGKSWHSNVSPWLLENDLLHVQSPRFVSRRLGQCVLAGPEGRLGGTRLTGHRTVESQTVGRDVAL